ncbi:polyprenyl synthetase family protein [Anaerococcus sp. Marseille-P9784]|uniref:polyprenyl synthetase family protein n=1 Tax=Anaerococcus sp. Marseille-P9784 TaxID=2614127 RepID=UPI001249EDC5|nr:polyprenyl synthetase family protein [Anaerococcus sp. Marseille-P9784]
MNNIEFEQRINENKSIIDNKIKTYFNGNYNLETPMDYALEGGKRIRASIFLETLKMLGKTIEDTDILFALALEMVHAYSLVHDDLPCMDNDDLRRGKATVHTKFGEDIAVLTGDALLNEAASLLFEISLENKSYIKASKYLLDHAGYKGMLGGQVLDLKRDIKATKDYIFKVYDKKTADLFRVSLVSPGLILDLSEDKLIKLENYAKAIGLGYQIKDDLLEENYKGELNILNILDKEDAINLLEEENKIARLSIVDFDDNDFLLELIDYLTKRDM